MVQESETPRNDNDNDSADFTNQESGSATNSTDNDFINSNIKFAHDNVISAYDRIFAKLSQSDGSDRGLFQFQSSKSYSLNEYQRDADRTAIYHGKKTPDGITYTVLGLTGESGELANKWKKYLRDYSGDSDATIDERLEEFKKAMRKELGDVLWYVASMASELDSTLEDIAKENILKLQSRKERGVLGGSGDDR